MFCIKCGKQIPDDSVFCMGCGTKVPQLNNTDVNVVKKEVFSKPVFDDEATKTIQTKRIIDDDEKTRVVLPPKTKSFESIVETSVETEKNEIFSHSQPQDIDVFSNSEEQTDVVTEDDEKTVLGIETEPTDIFSNSKEEPAQVLPNVEETVDIFSNSKKEIDEVLSKVEETSIVDDSDFAEETEDVFPNSVVKLQKLAKPQIEEDFDDEKTVFIGAYKEETVKAPEQPLVAQPIAPPINKPVAPPVVPPVNRPVAPPIAPPVSRPARNMGNMTVTMANGNDPIPANYGVPMRENNVVRPVATPRPANPYMQGQKPLNNYVPENNFVPEPVKKKRRIHPMAIILPIVAIILAVAIIFGSFFLFSDPKDRYYVSKRVTVRYDENGEVRDKETFEYFDEDVISLFRYEYEGEVTDESKYERDDKGRITKITKGTGENKKVYRFEYEKDGKQYVATGKCTVDDVTYKIEYAYEKDELVREKNYEDNALTYSMEKEGNTETQKYFEDGELKRMYIYEYDKKDNLVRIEYKTEVDSTEDYIVTYTYDKKGNMLEGKRTNSDGDIEARAVREYDKNGNLISSIEYNADEEITSKYTASYNKYDICIEYESCDENGEVIQYAKLRNESKDKIIVDYYDKDDNLAYYLEHTIEKNKLTETKFYDGATEKVKQSVKYNKEGLVIEERNYREDGSLTSKTTYEYAKKK